MWDKESVKGPVLTIVLQFLIYFTTRTLVLGSVVTQGQEGQLLKAHLIQHLWSN